MPVGSYVLYFYGWVGTECTGSPVFVDKIYLQYHYGLPGYFTLAGPPC